LFARVIFCTQLPVASFQPPFAHHHGKGYPAEGDSREPRIASGELRAANRDMIAAP
jgi:hypothetical protein